MTPALRLQPILFALLSSLGVENHEQANLRALLRLIFKLGAVQVVRFAVARGLRFAAVAAGCWFALTTPPMATIGTLVLLGTVWRD
jgi:hypothetical protein